MKNKVIGPGRSYPGIHILPDAINAIVGDIGAGTVDDIKEWADGNIITLVEVAATPGQNLEVSFIDVVNIKRVVWSAYYAGADNHFVLVQIYDYVATAWKTLHTMPNALGTNYRYSDIPVMTPIDRFNFIDANGNAKVRFYHSVAGNAAHKTYIDYVALVR